VAKTIFRSSDQQALQERLGKLKPAAQRQFGKMNAPQMICHLKDSLEVTTGQVPARQRKSFLSNPIIRHIIIYWMPWPKGKARTASEMLATKPGEWESDVATLRGLLDSAANNGPTGAWAPHPAFGKVSGKDYGALIYRHFDHHLKQFGV
jgi:hypothetical protein